MFDKEAYKKWYEEWKEKYHNKRFIDFSKYITEKEKQTLKKLNIKICHHPYLTPKFFYTCLIYTSDAADERYTE